MVRPTFPPAIDETYDIPSQGSWPRSNHRFTEESVWAIRASLAAKRPLLLRGEPGIGKSQLARAAAHVLGVPFLSEVVHERTERDDLLYTYDAVARLARAQLGPAIDTDESPVVTGSGTETSKKPDSCGTLSWKERMAESRFICPGVLWWAFDWEGAERQANDFSSHCRKIRLPQKNPTDWTPTDGRTLCGPVVLIDEIDKADPSVPNGLLESLGNEGFSTPQLDREVRLPEGAKMPLIIITTNEERELPAAFLRRCLVLQMRFPNEGNFESVKRFLIDDRARVNWKPELVSDAICERATDLLLRDRKAAQELQLPVPGAAEYLDLIRALVGLADEAEGKDREAVQSEALEEIHRFAYQKNLTESVEEVANQ